MDGRAVTVLRAATTSTPLTVVDRCDGTYAVLLPCAALEGGGEYALVLRWFPLDTIAIRFTLGLPKAWDASRFVIAVDPEIRVDMEKVLPHLLGGLASFKSRRTWNAACARTASSRTRATFEPPRKGQHHDQER